MIYPKDLDEYTESQLIEEVARRQGARLVGLCDYCGRSFNAVPPCKFPNRHKGVGNTHQEERKLRD